MAAANAIAKNRFYTENKMQMQNSEIQRRQWVLDEPDNLLSWLRGEFAAANAIIDALCQHLRIVGDSAEYDPVLTSIQQRRCNWATLLHMQQYFSVAEVLHALQQVSWRKQQRNADHVLIKDNNNNINNVSSPPVRYGIGNAGNARLRAETAKKLGHRVSSSQNGSKNGGFVSRGPYVENVDENINANSATKSVGGVNSCVAGSSSALQSGEGIHNLSGSQMIDFEKMISSSVKEKEQEESKDECQVHARSGNGRSNGGEKHEESKKLDSKKIEPSQGGSISRAEELTGAISKKIDNSRVSNHSGPCNDLTNCDFRFISKQEEDRRQSLIMVSKNFVGNELVNGKMVNIVEGLELYENIFDSSEISRLTSLVQELKLAGRKKELRGQTFVVSKRPMKGNGREMIQFGVRIMNVPLEGEITTGTMKDLVEPIPTVMEDVINRLFRWKLIRDKRPDSCIINFFNEGDHSQPHISPSYFERPFYMFSLLSECSMVFGRSITVNHPGDYKGPLKISLHAGSLMVMQGNSADIARYAICSSPVQRATITFVNVQPKKVATFSSIPMSMSHSSFLSNSHIPQPVDRQSSRNSLVSIPKEGQGVNQTYLKNFNLVQTSGVVPVPSIHTSQVNPCLPAPRIQPLFAGPTGSVGAYASVAVIPTAWSAVPRSTPRMSSSGTGVFFPGSGSGSNPCQCVTLPQQQQGVLTLSYVLPRSEPSFSGATSTEPPSVSCSTLRSSKPTTPNQLAFDNFDRDTERSSVLSRSLPGKFDLAAPKTALSKDIVNKAPKMDSNGSRTPKSDQLNRTCSLSERTANKANTNGVAGGSS